MYFFFISVHLYFDQIQWCVCNLIREYNLLYVRIYIHTLDSCLYLISKLTSQRGFWFPKGAWFLMGPQFCCKQWWLDGFIRGGDEGSVWIFMVMALGILALFFFFLLGLGWYFDLFVVLDFEKMKMYYSWKFCSPFVFVYTILETIYIYIYILFIYYIFPHFMCN